MAKDAFAHIEDKELLDKFYADHNNQWLGILLQRYTMLLLGVCMKYLKNEEDAKDGVQQIFLKSITELQKYRIEYFKSWLYMVAKNYCLMYLRDHNKHIPDELKEQHSKVVPDEDDSEQRREKEYLLQRIEEALQTLNEEQRKCVILFYLHKKSYQEITEATGFSLLQVKSFIQNGKRNIKLWVEKNNRQ